MIRNIARRRYALVLLALFVALAPSQAWAEGQCELFIQSSNLDRYVYGAFSAECPGNWPHSAPFGNWGVDSLHGSRYDGYQFAGWYNDDGWQQWNSCTTHVDYDAPDCTYLNYESCTTQLTDVGTYVFSNFYSGVMDWPCSDYGEIFTVSNLFMAMYELDAPGSDTHVATAYYPSINVVLTDGGGYYYGTSSATSPSSVSGTWGSVLTAKIQVYVQLSDL